jgi:hypothetical protein
MWLNFVPRQNHKSTQHHPHHGPADDPFKTIIIIIIWTYQDIMEWMNRILDGELAGADEDFGSVGLGSWANVAEFCPKPKPQIHSASSSWAR